MIRRFESESEPVDRDERLGEAIETYLAQAETGAPPDPDEFVSRYPDLGEDLRAALDGLAMVRGLVGDASGPGNRLEAGRRVAGYKIVRELGRGGMGIVYEAVHVDLDRPVALKVLGMHAAPDSTGRRRFLNEARTAAGLHHTHIVPVFDVGQVGGLCYYAMQRIEGCGLDRVLKAMRRERTTAAGTSGGHSARTPVSPHTVADSAAASRQTVPDTVTWAGGGSGKEISQTSLSGPATGRPAADTDPPFVPPRGAAYYRWVAGVGRQAAEALAHAHRRGVVHRDIKPSNLLADARGTIWVADFGLARREADPGLTQSDSLLGTPRYMSPEQVDNGPTDSRTDVYSLSATLYELLTLRPPFDGRTTSELSRQIATKDPASPRTFDRRIPLDLETIALKGIAKRPADRYASAEEMAEDLQRFLNREPVKARRIGPLGRLWRVALRHPGISAVSTVATITVLAVASYAYLRVVHERDRAVQANVQAQSALQATEEANRKEKAQTREYLLSTASINRMSPVPRRRERGFDMIKKAVSLGPDPGQRLKLRSEAAEYLALRDVEERKPHIESGRNRGLIFGAAGLRLATLSEESREFRLWDIANRQLSTGPLKSGPDSPPSFGGGFPRGPNAPKLAAVGHHVAVLWPDGHGIRLFDASTGARVADLPTPEREITGLFATGASEPRLVTVERAAVLSGKEPDGFQVNLWDIGRMDAPLKTLFDWGGQGPMILVSMAPDGETIATSFFNQALVSLWSTRDGKPLGTIDTQAPVQSLALGPEGVVAVATGNEAIRLWEVEARVTPAIDPRGVLPTLSVHALPSLNYQGGFVRVLRFSPDGSLLAVAGANTGVELWDPAANMRVAALPILATERSNDLAFSPNGQMLAISQGASVGLWAIREPLGLFRYSGFKDTGGTPVFGADVSLAFGPEGMLAMAMRGSPLHLWCSDQCPMAAHTWEGVTPSAVLFDGKGRFIACDVDSLRWYEPSARELVQQVVLPEFGGPRASRPPARSSGARSSDSNGARPPRSRSMFRGPMAVARTADGQTIAIAMGRFGDVFLCPVDAPENLRRIVPPPPPAPPRDRPERGRGFGPGPWRGLAIAPEADRLYLVGMEELHVWSIKGDHAERIEWEIPRGVTGLALSPDGRTLAIGDRTGKVALIDTKSGKIRARLLPFSEDDEGEVRALAFAPQGDELAVGSRSGAVRLWLLSGSPMPIIRLPAHSGAVHSLVYDPSGQHLASSGQEKTVTVWDLKRVRDELGPLGLRW